MRFKYLVEGIYYCCYYENKPKQIEEYLTEMEYNLQKYTFKWK